MKKLLTVLAVSLLIGGCKQEKCDPIKIVIHDTVTVTKRDGGAFMDKTIKILLIQYYKAGWMDAYNGIIDLNNNNTLTDYRVRKIRDEDWRAIEKEVISK